MKIARLIHPPAHGLIGSILLLLVLHGCSTAPKAPKPVQPIQTPSKQVEIKPLLAQDYIAQAAQVYARSGNTFERNRLLLQAAELLLKTQTESNSAAAKTLGLLQSLYPQLSQRQQIASANLLMLKAYFRQAANDTGAVDAETSKHYLSLLERIQPQHLLTSQQQDYWQVTAQVYEGASQPIAAAAAWVNYMQVDNLASHAARFDQPSAMTTTEIEEIGQRIWRLLTQTNSATYSQQATDYPELSDWLALVEISEEYITQPQQLADTVSAWQQAHPLANKLPNALAKAIAEPDNSLQSIAVVLPLSGRLASQGQAIKDGILAAYFDELAKQQTDDNEYKIAIRYLDSNLLSAQEIAEQSRQADAVIGPLLKDNIANLLPELALEQTVLALNQSENLNSSREPVLTPAQSSATTSDIQPSQRYFFALSPEDEAQQLAERIWRQGLRRPILVASENSISQRMTSAFLQSWQALDVGSKQLPALATFSDSKDMRKKVTTMLDVRQSQSRIRQIERMFREEVHNVARNRQDIDSVVVFASPEETELLNPLVESSISPFSAQAVQVYASSRSHKQALSKNSQRDLRKLTFTEQPWLLPSKTWRSQQANAQLWQERSDGLQRLYAFGYDAYRLLPHLSRLKTLDYAQMQGMTGQLSVSSSGEVARQLAFGRIDEQQGTLVAMD